MTGANLVLIGIFIPVILLMAFTPYLTRRTEAFGVTVPDGVKQQSYIARHIKRYMLLCLGLGIILIAAMFILIKPEGSEQDHSIWYSVIIVSYLALTFLVFIVSHMQIKAWKQQQPWYEETSSSQKIVVQTGFHKEKTTISLVWYVPHIIVVALAMGYSIIHYDKFPELLPMQYDFNGEVTRAVEKSIGSVLTLSWLSIAMIIVFIISHLSIARSKQVIESQDPHGSLQRNVIFRYSWSVFLAIAGFLVVILMVLGQLSPLLEWSSNTFMVIVFTIVGIILLGSILLSVKLGQGGSRLKNSNTQQGKASVEVADLDQYWKLGIFYVNRNDPAIFVEKRFGVGWSINYGNPIAWLITIGILAIVLIPAIFL
ncbi:DUF1648 domain-containing protein [Paenibacillus sp. FSL W7-1287]|uniref:DUF1648 domain-containing protein n=1 Tax=Paenibacillus sp. FSL W7-1287 TaxID=2954538 RepID=UPI0030F86258